MKKKTKLIIFAMIFCFIVFLIFVNFSKKINLDYTHTTQIANPASKYCIQQNGTLEMKNDENGQYGVCIKNGKECEEWKLFRGECSFNDSLENECNVDSDCVPSSCCHPVSCVNKNNALDCSGIKCTMECKLNSLDCGQGSCICENKRCGVKLI